MRFLLACLASIGAAMANASQSTSPNDKSSQDSREAVASAFKALEAPESDLGASLNQMKATLVSRLMSPSAEAMYFLAKTKVAVDSDLLKLAKADKPLRVRFRAVQILTQRRNPAVVPVLEKMCASAESDERYVAWFVYLLGVGEGKLTSPQDFATYIALYEQEKDSEVRVFIEKFFGTTKAKQAVSTLSKTVKSDHEALAAIRALADIGDKSAVPVIIEAFEGGRTGAWHLIALGKLATPEAVDFIIKNLDEPGAVGGLWYSKSEKALPALKKHLEKLRNEEGPDHDFYLAETRIVIECLRHKDPREPLLKIAEDQQEGYWMRCGALMALQQYDAALYAKRILKMYENEPDSWFKCKCIELLAESKLDGITEAMMEHALMPEQSGDGSMEMESALLKALNNRLGTSFANLHGLRRYVKMLRESMPEK